MTTAEKLVAQGYSAEDLDELVIRVMSRAAEELNNGGLEEQVKFLEANGWKEEAILNYLNDEL